jgi:hypothetical protein
MIKKEKYTDINAVMRGVRIQVIDSLYFCVNEMPRFDTPEQMWNNLKNMVVFKHDPPGVELLQSVPTLMTNNFWGVPGAGDCDCFTILVLSMCIANGWNDQRIVLAGRSKRAPVHIWSEVKYKDRWYCMDLTQPFFDYPRKKYKFYQYLNV